jgi:uncharacterized protein YodC (DUF2158 family)
MSKEINTGGPAFPVSTIDGFRQDGMDLRDWFAGMVLQGIASHSDYHETTFNSVAEHCYLQADAMLAARGEK